MIDYENEIIDGVAKTVGAVFPDALVTSVGFNAPASFPSVSVFESSNVVNADMSDSGSIERSAVVTYDAYAYSNLRTGAKQQAKALMAEVDGFMAAHNFTRTYSTQGAHPTNASVYQVYCRYIAAIGEDGKIYRRL